LLGCGDERVVERFSPELGEEARDIAARAILTGVPFVGLEAEGNPHVEAAVALARIDQTLDGVGSNFWNMQPIRDLARVLPALARDSLPLRVFLEGRPIFGKQIKPAGAPTASSIGPRSTTSAARWRPRGKRSRPSPKRRS
jgi:hypothetical protein